jgi:flavin reductase (DIM6/NTAB) family NADH-FMN oxidoreductase RutF
MLRKDVDPAKIHRLFYPQVPVIITAEHGGLIGGMPAIWCMPLSFKPPLVGVAVAPEHETYRIITGARAFGMNWLNFSYAAQVGELGETSAKDVKNKLAAAGFTVTKGEKTSQPLIQEASAVLECQLSETHHTGTHELLIGEVVGAFASDGFHDYWDFSKYNPLLYAGTVNGKGKSWVFKSIRGESAEVLLKHQV